MVLTFYFQTVLLAVFHQQEDTPLSEVVISSGPIARPINPIADKTDKCEV